jgi:hypothetical protein
MEVLQALHSKNTAPALAFKTANEEYEEACAVIKAKDAKLTVNETALNNDKLCLKEQVSEPQQERQPRTETWKHREAEQKDREELWRKSVKK